MVIVKAGKKRKIIYTQILKADWGCPFYEGENEEILL